MKKIILLICMAIFVAVSFSCKKEPAKEEVQNVDERQSCDRAETL